MDLNLKKTEKDEFFQTENLTRETFWNLYNPGCNEHLVLHQLRRSKGYIKELDCVAIIKGEIIGHIISTKALVFDSQNHEQEVLCVGPCSVFPSFQKQGIGTKLLSYSISWAEKMGFNGMILFGNPDYFHRLGFKSS